MRKNGQRYKKPKCVMCGECCKKLGFGDLKVTVEDYRRWKREGREDILRYVWLPPGSPGFGDIWIDPETGENLDYCPFLKRVSEDKYICTIHNTKPEVCKKFWCKYAYGVGGKGERFND